MRVFRTGLQTGRARAWLLLTCTLAGCGLRSEALGEFRDDGRIGSCSRPIEMPFENLIAEGRIAGQGQGDAWCGGESDDGSEDVYVLRPAGSSDVTIEILKKLTTFKATVSVFEGGCTAEDDPLVCTTKANETPFHFWAEAGKEYYLRVDSPLGTEGKYGFKMTLGWPQAELCPVHPMPIVQQPGGTFRWRNRLGTGQGRVFSKCDAAGAENMFRVQFSQPGSLRATVKPVTGSFTPVLSFRTSCGAVSELVCVDARDARSNAVLDVAVPMPGEYFLVVDQQERPGSRDGSPEYELEINFR